MLTINDYDIEIGANGPISGTITTTKTDGFTTTMTYSSDGTSSGKVYKDGNFVADIFLDADGTGTYMDSFGMIYPIY